MRLPAKLFTFSALIFLGRLAGAAVMFGTQALIAKWFSAAALGQYLQANAAANLCAVLLPLGFQISAAYFAAEYVSLGLGRTLRAFVKRAYLQTAVMAALFLVAGDWLLPRILPGNPGITQNWMQICIFASAIALASVSCNVLVGMKRPVLGLTADMVMRPLLIAGGLAFVLIPGVVGLPIPKMLWFAGSTYLIVATVTVVVAIRKVRQLAADDIPARGEIARWWNYALPWTLIGLATDFFFDLDLLLLSGSLSYSELAVFGVMTRLFSLASFGVSSVYLISLPDMYAEHARADVQSFKARLKHANLAAMGIALTMALGIAATGHFVLSFFGPEFQQGLIPLVILALALAMRCIFGPAALTLSMHRKPYAALPSVALGLFCLVAGNVILVPAFGLYGAAVSALLAMSVWSISMWWQALKLTGTDISIIMPVWSLIRIRWARG